MYRSSVLPYTFLWTCSANHSCCQSSLLAAESWDILEYCFFLILDHEMSWFERDLKDNLVPTLCHGQGHLPPEQVAACQVFRSQTRVCRCLHCVFMCS